MAGYKRRKAREYGMVKFGVGFIEGDIELVAFGSLPWPVLVRMGTDADPRGLFEHVPDDLTEILLECDSDELGEFLNAWIEASTEVESEKESFADAFERIIEGFK